MHKLTPNTGFSASIRLHRPVRINGKPVYKVARYFSVMGLTRKTKQIGLISYCPLTGWLFSQLVDDNYETGLSTLASKQVDRKLAKLNAAQVTE